MKTLQSLLATIPFRLVQGTLKTEITSVCIDSRQVQRGSLFIATRGTVTDGNKFIPMALEKGAVAIIGEHKPSDFPADTTFLELANAGQWVGEMAAAFYDNPSEKLKIVAVTGTNGKTTTATLLYDLFSELGYKTGLLSTIENKISDEVLPSKLTTPDPVSVQALLAEMLKKGCTHAFMEASSHALVQGRLNGIRLSGGVFTNISRDHLDYHGTFEKYIAAKKILFDILPKRAFALVNIDDKRGNIMLQNTKAKRHTFALRSYADYHGKILDNTFEGLSMEINGQPAWFRLIGEFNAYNLLTVYAVANLLGEPDENVLTVLSGLEPASGRFEQITGPKQVKAIVDYAHTPDALENVLKTILQVRLTDQKVTTVVGCGGDRDKGKRPQMATVAAKYSNRVILTSDNPRSEAPQQIIADMEAGLGVLEKGKTEQIVSRKEAIAHACQTAQKGEVILIAGKGHETYQEISGFRHHFDDREEVRKGFSKV